MAKNAKRIAEARRRARRPGDKLRGADVEELYRPDRGANGLGLSPLERQIQRRTVSPRRR